MDRTATQGRRDDPLLALLREVRDEVCSRCSGLPVGSPDPPPCGGELTLCQMVQALLPGPLADRAELPASGRPLCPLPPDDIAELTAEVAEEMERKQAQRERLVSTWDD